MLPSVLITSLAGLDSVPTLGAWLAASSYLPQRREGVVPSQVAAVDNQGLLVMPTDRSPNQVGHSPALQAPGGGHHVFTGAPRWVLHQPGSFWKTGPPIGFVPDHEAWLD